VAKRNKNRNNRKNLLDEKGRVSIPAGLRKKLNIEKEVVLTKGVDPCIKIYTKEYWEELKEKYKALPLGSFSHRSLVRKVYGEHEEVEIDPQGRIRLPGNLLEYAGIKRECFFVQMPWWIEIWDPERYKSHMEKANEIRDLENLPL